MMERNPIFRLRAEPGGGGPGFLVLTQRNVCQDFEAELREFNSTAHQVPPTVSPARRRQRRRGRAS
jgi:hypothetical protein